MDQHTLSDRVIAWRRDLHRIPGVGYDLGQTADYVERELRKMGLCVTRLCGGSGLCATIDGAGDGKTVALRADMDALPIREETGLPFASTNGCMHACGHDGHMAQLLGAAALLCGDKSFPGHVRLLFQPAEENQGGARKMIEDGALDGVDAVFGMHIGYLTDAPSGMFSFREGTSMAGFSPFDITIRGRGGHGARPEDGVDPIVAASQVVMALQTLASREHAAADPFVCTIGSIHGGVTYNIIPDTVTMKGGMRVVSEETREYMKERMTQLVRGVCAAMRARGEVEFSQGYLCTINDAHCTQLAHDTARELFGEESVEWMKQPIMVSEDVSEYLARVPGCFWLYATPGTGRCHHRADFDIAEELLWRGSLLEAQTARRFLLEG